MTLLLTFAVCFFACVVGAICGVGGGIIIKPTLDAMGIMDVAAISFLSGCTVISMTFYSVIRSRRSGVSRIDPAVGSPLTLGAAAGGILGKHLFQTILNGSADAGKAGAVQAACLLLVTVGTLVYTLLKSRIPTHLVKNRLACIVIGLTLGVLSSFLGIGGGPVNLVVLFYFFSMDTKTAVENSLYIILFSQMSSLIISILTQTVPAFSAGMLCLMVAGGISGGILGRGINQKLDGKAVERLFIALMAFMIAINLYNIYHFSVV